MKLGDLGDMKPVGYLTNHATGIAGDKGRFYDYVLAGNGLFLEVEGKFLSARIPIAKVEIRGIPPLEPYVVLHHGKIPYHLWERGLELMYYNPHIEQYVVFTYENGYMLRRPPQINTASAIIFQTEEAVVMDMHSHGNLGAFFSSVDDLDETGFRFYGVCGNLVDAPEVKIRLGVYGYFYALAWEDVFEGTVGIREVAR